MSVQVIGTVPAGDLSIQVIDTETGADLSIQVIDSEDLLVQVIDTKAV